MKRLAPYFGSLGAGFLAAGILLRFTQPQRDRFWASFLIAGLVLTVLYLVNRWSEVAAFAGRRSARRGANTALLTLIVAGIVAAINYIAYRHAERWDFTAAQQYTLSEQTTKLVSELERDVEIVFLDDPRSPEALVARDLLELYDAASPRVDVEILDPEAEPSRALVYRSPTEPRLTLGTVIVEVGERQERATAATEPEITNALLRALAQETKKIYFTAGHQEKELSEMDGAYGLSVVASKLQDSTYETEALVLARSVVEGKLQVPDDAAAVVVAGPLTDFLPEEIDALDRYIRSGGDAIFLIDPAQQATTPNLTAYLGELGVVVGDDVVLDPMSLPPVTPVVRSYGRHPIVESFGNAISVLHLARSVSPSEDLPEGTDVQTLFETTDELSWAETRLEELAQREGPAPDQKTGPIDLAVAVEIEIDTPEAAAAPEEGSEPASDGDDAALPTARIVVVGDSDFVANELASAPVLNANLFLNMVNWVAQDEDRIAIRPREPEDRRIAQLTRQQRANVWLLTRVLIPGIIFVTGISVWWGRR